MDETCEAKPLRMWLDNGLNRDGIWSVCLTEHIIIISVWLKVKWSSFVGRRDDFYKLKAHGGIIIYPICELGQV